LAITQQGKVETKQMTPFWKEEYEGFQMEKK